MPQYAVPTGDISFGTWLSDSDVADLYSQINLGLLEGNFNDSVYIKQTAGPPSTGVVGLTNLTDPVVHTGHFFGIRGYTSVGSLTVNVALYQGATTQIFNTGLSFTSTTTNFSGEIPSGDIANITDYSDLRAYFIAPGLSPEPRITEFQLQIPDAPITDQNIYPNAYLIFV